MWPGKQDPHVSEGEERRGVPVRESMLGCGLLAVLGRMASPRPFFYFYFLFFFTFSVFLISFLDFAYCIQTRSNQFLNFL
jgi:hypothetical protein